MYQPGFAVRIKRPNFLARQGISLSNQVLRQMLVARIREAIERSRQATLVAHPGLIGRIREIAIESLFQPLLPSDFEIGTGKISDCHGTQSGQIDVLIHSKRLLPPLMYDEKFGMFPLESCFRAIEVKSVLTSTELQKSITSARQISTGLKYLPGQFDPNGTTVFHEFKKIGSALFAFGTDLASKDELTRYKENDTSWPDKPAIRALCIVGAGCWLRTTTNAWIHIPPTSEHDEVIEFLLACVGELQQELISRKQPRLNAYISNYVTVVPTVLPNASSLPDA